MQRKISMKRISEEREIFQQKIEMVESQLEEERELSVGLKVELEQAITDITHLRSKLNDMTAIY